MAEETQVVEQPTGTEAPPTETHEAETQTGEQQAGEKQEAPKEEPKAEERKAERKSLKQLRQEDPEFNAEYEHELAQHVNKRLKRAEDKRLRQEVKAAKGDPDRSLELVDKLDAMPEPEDEDEDFSPQQRLEHNVRALQDQSDKGMAWLLGEPEYAFMYQHHKAELDGKLGELTGQDWARWVLKEGRERDIDFRADAKAKSQAKTLAEAMATDQTAKALRDVPQPLNGGAGGGATSDDDKLAAYAEGKIKLSREEYLRISERRR